MYSQYMEESRDLLWFPLAVEEWNAEPNMGGKFTPGQKMNFIQYSSSQSDGNCFFHS